VSRLLSRYAESLFWLARYIERAENLARILEVQETFARDSKGSQDWSVVLKINADTERFFAEHEGADSNAVLRFYVTERTNPTSLISNLYQARENARALRPLISTEMWVQLNVFHNRLAALRPSDVTEQRLSRLCSIVKEGCDAHAGITAGTFYRDEAYAFYELGAAIECADQTTRLLDAKFLAAKARADASPGSAADASYWVALLRSAAGYQAFRRRHPGGLNAEQVATFMICDPSFPRSVACNLGIIEGALTRLRRHYRLRPASAALEELDALTATLDVRNVQEMLLNRDALHLYTDYVQRSLADLTDHLGKGFFGYGAPAPVSAETASQSTDEMSQSLGPMTQTMGSMSQSMKPLPPLSSSDKPER
jgi:uncharacterized alpha-E superfamily protein